MNDSLFTLELPVRVLDFLEGVFVARLANLRHLAENDPAQAHRYAEIIEPYETVLASLSVTKKARVKEAAGV